MMGFIIKKRFLLEILFVAIVIGFKWVCNMRILSFDLRRKDLGRRTTCVN